MTDGGSSNYVADGSAGGSASSAVAGGSASAVAGVSEFCSKIASTNQLMIIVPLQPQVILCLIMAFLTSILDFWTTL